MEQGDNNSSSRPQGAGDKIFAAAGKIFAEVKRGEVLSAISKLKQSGLKEAELPPAVEQAVANGARVLRGKFEDFKEVAGDLVDLALAKREGLAYKVASALELASQSELKRLEKRVLELEKENLELKAKVEPRQNPIKRGKKSSAKSGAQIA